MLQPVCATEQDFSEDHPRALDVERPLQAHVLKTFSPGGTIEKQ